MSHCQLKDRSSVKESTLSNTSCAKLLSSLEALHQKYFTCSLCSNPLMEANFSLRCNHRFCGHCVSETLVKYNKNCPICKAWMPSFRKDEQYAEIGREMSTIISEQIEFNKNSYKCMMDSNVMGCMKLTSKASPKPTNRRDDKDKSNICESLKRKRGSSTLVNEKRMRDIMSSKCIDTRGAGAIHNNTISNGQMKFKNDSIHEMSINNLKEVPEHGMIENQNDPFETPPGHGGLVARPGENDVLNGRGGRINSHLGNIYFRHLISLNKETYLSSKKLDKVKIAGRIVQNIRGRNPSGRFLVEDADTGLWIEIGDDKARKKAGQAMREKSGGFLANSRSFKSAIDISIRSPNTDLERLASVALYEFASSHDT